MFSTGFIADLDVNPGFKRIAFRTDMDALPADEKLDTEYSSQHPGAAHLCGHDFHMAIALTTARFMTEHKDNLKANVRFVFQPCEEILLINGGAKGMIESGCLSGVDEIYGLHNMPTLKTGSVHIREGAMSSNGDSFEITLQGKSSHASTPNKGLDTIRESARIIDEFNRIIACNCSPMQPAFISVGTLTAGEASNIIPAYAKLTSNSRL